MRGIKDHYCLKNLVPLSFERFKTTFAIPFDFLTILNVGDRKVSHHRQKKNRYGNHSKIVPAAPRCWIWSAAIIIRDICVL
jgi:hypothetical protein